MHTKQNQKTNKVISVDWLSYFFVSEEIKSTNLFHVKHLDFGNKIFKDMFTVYHKGEEVFSISKNPRSSIIKKNSGVLKVSNQLLYSKNCFNVLSEFIKEQEINILSVNRLDICCDFQNTIEYENPETIISGFMQRKILKRGRGTFAVFGDQKERHYFNYLRFGKKGADINAYIYNKTKEFKDTKEKKYISEIWKKAKFEEKKDVWRLEFSLKNEAISFLDKDSGALTKGLCLNIFDENEIKKVFFCLQKKHFSFVKNENKDRKSRMQEVILFDEIAEVVHYTKKDRAKIVGRSEKMLVSRLQKFKEEMETMLNADTDDIADVISHVVVYNELQDWYNGRYKKIVVK